MMTAITPNPRTINGAQGTAPLRPASQSSPQKWHRDLRKGGCHPSAHPLCRDAEHFEVEDLNHGPHGTAFGGHGKYGRK